MRGEVTFGMSNVLEFGGRIVRDRGGSYAKGGRLGGGAWDQRHGTVIVLAIKFSSMSRTRHFRRILF